MPPLSHSHWVPSGAAHYGLIQLNRESTPTTPTMASSKACLLCFFIILSIFTGSTESASCCLRYRKRPVPCKRAIGYTIQTINTSCDIDAIIFHVGKSFVCADPSVSWTQRLKECLDQRRRNNADILKEGTQSPTASAVNPHDN